MIRSVVVGVLIKMARSLKSAQSELVVVVVVQESDSRVGMKRERWSRGAGYEGTRQKTNAMSLTVNARARLQCFASEDLVDLQAGSCCGDVEQSGRSSRDGDSRTRIERALFPQSFRH